MNGIAQETAGLAAQAMEMFTRELERAILRFDLDTTLNHALRIEPQPIDFGSVLYAPLKQWTVVQRTDVVLHEDARGEAGMPARASVVLIRNGDLLCVATSVYDDDGKRIVR